DHVEKGLSLCFGEQEYYQLCYKIDKNRLVIASEKTEKNDKWELLKNNQLLVGKISNGSVVKKIFDVC
ncbi:MAG: hypothetical protein AB1779_10035, partial [Candidatus Thermoplasmatota archaeon]